MVLLSVVATLAAGMVWQQWRAVQVESAERSRAQTAWLLVGALDWARLILREDARSGKVTSLNEPWATPLAEARLSSFLAVDRDNNADAEAGPEAFLAGAISDAQSRYNLRNLVAENQVAPAQLAALQRLCSSVGLGPDTADLLASGLLASARSDSTDAPLAPQQMADLTWLGLDAASIERLSSVAVLLPAPTPINLNTASREVMAAVVPGLDLGSADRLVQARARRPLRNLADATEVLGPGIKLTEGVVDVRSAYFEVRGRLRLAQRVLELQSLVQRRSGLQVVAIQRQVQASLSPAGR
ncbi:MAG: general secretion pathway protein GspK [Burkholderiales bacterium RIFCSPHIGHO2_12_FULL_69_20]|nr:MAG: general secretion pathway protein GspK [Burkholderiales bacterium RIFCSPHIGHO2_12_FULL_69_20]